LGSPTARIENRRLRGTNGHSKRSGEKKANPIKSYQNLTKFHMAYLFDFVWIL